MYRDNEDAPLWPGPTSLAFGAPMESSEQPENRTLWDEIRWGSRGIIDNWVVEGRDGNAKIPSPLFGAGALFHALDNDEYRNDRAHNSDVLTRKLNRH
jgi:hypothetical protein